MFRIYCGDDIQTFTTTFDNTFYLLIGDKYVPDKQWTDLSLPILKDWIDKLVCFYQGTRKKDTFYFLDGPYEVVMSLFKENFLDISAFHYGDIIERTTASLDDVAKEMLRAGKELEEILRAKGLEKNWDLKSLQKAMSSLKKISMNNS